MYVYVVQKNNTDIETDNLEEEHENVHKRATLDDPNEGSTNSYDSTLRTQYYESEGTYEVHLVAQRRSLRIKKSEEHLYFLKGVKTSLLGSINHSK